MKGRGCYKHSAPLEPGANEGPRVLQTFGSAGAARGNEGRVLQTIGVSRMSDGTEGLWQRIRMEP